MKKYIIINGTLGSGKSTVGRLIAEMLGSAAFIEGDFVIEMYPHIDYKETEEMQRDNILHMSKNYSNFNKCDSVILSWIIGEERTKNIISELCKLNFQVFHFILTCSKEVLIKRWNEDDLNDWRNDENLDTAISMLENFNKRSDCIVIDTSELTATMVAKKIIELIHSSKIKKRIKWKNGYCTL